MRTGLHTNSAEGGIVWRPNAELINQSNLRYFMAENGLGSLEELQKRSTSDISWFWDTILRDLNIHFRRPYSPHP